MKKLSFLAVCVFVMIFSTCSLAESGIMVEDVVYNGEVMTGYVTGPAGNYYARVTMYLSGGVFIVLSSEIINGIFEIHIASNCEAFTVQVVDHMDAYEPGTYYVYSWFTYSSVGM